MTISRTVQYTINASCNNATKRDLRDNLKCTYNQNSSEAHLKQKDNHCDKERLSIANILPATQFKG